ncbi:MAG: hypothetical protein R6X25_02090 [Candidatus Krumholzibacteriia bacterium]
MRDGTVVVRTYPNEVLARADANMLEAYGIRALVMKDDCGGMRPHLGWPQVVRLLVWVADAEEARALLEPAEQPADDEGLDEEELEDLSSEDGFPDKWLPEWPVRD